MSLDPTARESNVRDSIKKFFVDNLETGEGIPVGFDRSLSLPDTANVHTDRWLKIGLGPIDPNNLMVVGLEIICCTRSDPEGFKLSQLRDKVLGYLTDTARISFYRSYSDRAWEFLGAFMVFPGQDSGDLEAEDGTKFKVIPVTLKTGSKI